MNKTSIEWTDYTWNPVTGCTKISQGCKNCYAETMTRRFEKSWGHSFKEIKFHGERLESPGSIKKPSKIFVCDMSDLFHEEVDFNYIREIFQIIRTYDHHTYQILTKRIERVIEYQNWWNENYVVPHIWPDNVWLGTSCEDQATANERVPVLLQVPAAVRFLSCEPLLGPIDFHFQSNCMDYGHADFGCPGLDSHKLHWVIVGGESGRNARPMHPDWVRSIRDQCDEHRGANIPFFFKQWGEWINYDQMPAHWQHKLRIGESRWPIKAFESDNGLIYHFHQLGKSKSGNFLDGKQYLQFPETLNQQPL